MSDIFMFLIFCRVAFFATDLYKITSGHLVRGNNRYKSELCESRTLKGVVTHRLWHKGEFSFKMIMDEFIRIPIFI